MLAHKTGWGEGIDPFCLAAFLLTYRRILNQTKYAQLVFKFRSFFFYINEPKNQKDMISLDIFNPPISKTKVRNGVYAYRYNTGVVQIGQERYIGYTMAESIKIWRSKN